MQNKIRNIDPLKVPKHVAIIMDGNGRWAKAKGLSRVEGHREGVKSVKEIVEASGELGIQYLTLYAFSTENWNRPKDEVDALMNLLVETLMQELEELLQKNIRLHTIGEIQSLPDRCVRALQDAVENTKKKNQKLHLVLALSYGSRLEILQAVKNIGSKIKMGQLSENEIDEHLFGQFLYTKEIPDPDLLIRTSGEKRISNFLLWQCAYTEFYFTEVFWPDFRKEQFYEAIHDYAQRERRFGLISEQIKK